MHQTKKFRRERETYCNVTYCNLTRYNVNDNRYTSGHKYQSNVTSGYNVPVPFFGIFVKRWTLSTLQVKRRAQHRL